MIKRRVVVIGMVTMVVMTALSAMAPAAHADGGDFSLDFIAAGPFTYDHLTGVGGEFADRTISKTDGVVESLEGGDFSCGDRVVYFTEIVVDDGATGEQDIELEFSFLAETTGQPGAGHEELLSASRNTGDSGESGEVGDTAVSILSQFIDEDPPPAKDTLFATVRVENLDPGEVFILRLVTLLACEPNSDPTGNLQAALESAETVPDGDAIGSGAQTIPFKDIQDLREPAGVRVTVGECPEPGSPTVPVTVDITPAGSATVTILGEGGPYVVTGNGDTLDLEPGDYTWTAVAEPGFILDAPTSGAFTVQGCPFLPAAVTVDVGSCPAPGSPTVPVTVTIDPDSGATVTIEGPGGPYVVTGDGDVLDLPPGEYTWTAEAAPTYELDVTSGEFTVQECPFLPASVTVEVGACPAPGSATVPVTVTIDPAGSATVTIEGAGGPYVVTGEGEVLDLPAGDYTWTAEAAPTYELDATSGEFAVQECPAILASVNVTVGACPPTSSATKPATVTINPDGAAEVTLTGPNGFNQVISGTGATLDLAPGTYTWTAVANPTFELIGPAEGAIQVGSCVIEVLPKKVLPKTGTELPGLGALGIGLVLLGVGMVAVSRRPAPAASSIGSTGSTIVDRLSGRNDWASFFAPGWVEHIDVRARRGRSWMRGSSEGRKPSSS